MPAIILAVGVVTLFYSREQLQLRKQAGRRGAAGSAARRRRRRARIVAYVLWGYLGMGRAPIFPLPDFS